MKSFVSAPLIGPWLYRRSVKELADRAREGDEVAVRNLAGIFCTSHDAAVRHIARIALCSLVALPAIDTLCKEVLIRDNTTLLSIATECNYRPSDPGTQALFLFITGQQELYTQCDPLPHRPLLSSGYTQATSQGRFHARNMAKKNVQCPVLAAALMGKVKTRNTPPWSEEEWETVVTGLVQERHWEDLWPLVIHAPLDSAIIALTNMNAAGWEPAGDDRALWEGIFRTIPREWACPVPEDATSSTLWSPDSQPLRLAFSHDGSLLAAGCADGTICLWNTRTGTLLFRLRSGQGSINGLDLSPDNTHLLSTGTDGTFQCHDTITGTLLWSVSSGERIPARFACFRDGIGVVLPGAVGHLRIVNMADGQVQVLYGGHEAAVTCIALSHGDRLCAFGYADGAVGIWDLDAKQYLKTREGLGDPVSSLTFCEGNAEIVVIYNQHRPVRWHRGSGVRARTYNGHTSPLHRCSITPDGSSFAIAGNDQILRFWQEGEIDPVAEIPLYKRPLVVCTVSSDSRTLAAGFTDGSLRIYAMIGGKTLLEYKAHKEAITAIAMATSVDMIASAGWDGAVKLWNCTSGELVHTLLIPAGGVTGITTTPDGSSILAGYTDGKVRQIQYITEDFAKTLDMYTSTIRAIAISPDGTLIACAGGDTTLRIWNIETGGLVTGIEGLTTTQRCLAFSPDGKMVVSGGWDGKVRLWSVPGGNLLKTLAGHTSIITAVVITPDGVILATGSNDRSVRLWTLADGQCISVREDSRSEVSALALSPDGTLLAFAGTDAVIHLCHIPAGGPAPAIPTLPGKITALVFAGEGRVLVAGLDTGTVAVFSCARRNLLRTMKAHTAAVTGIVVLPGGESVLTSGLDGQVRYGNLPWTRPLSGTTLDDIPLVARYEHTCSRPDAEGQWAFLYGMLASRFTNDIELCTAVNDSGEFDIQIVG
jgi:WD40 repeat protein